MEEPKTTDRKHAFGYPVALELAGRRAVVIGAGAVHLGKVDGLLAGGATEVFVVADGPAGRLDALDADDRVRVERRQWRPDDLEGAVVCVAWSPDPAERTAIAREARARGVLVNVIDDVHNCDWAAPAVVRRGDLVVAIVTGGRSPALARRLREELSERFGEEWADLVDLVGEVREETLPAMPDLHERSRLWQEALDIEEFAGLLRSGNREEARALLLRRLAGRGVA